MQRLKYLDDWARAFLSVPRDSVEILFGREDVVRQSIESLPFYTRHRAGFRQLPPDLLLALHAHVHMSRAERGLWEALLFVLEHALPDEVANDLIDRSIAVSWLGHSRQSDSVMWRLAPLVEEALSTMAMEIYTWPQHSVQDLQQVLERAPDNWMLLNALSHARPSSPDKRAAFERAIENNPQRDRYLLNPPNDVASTREQVAAGWQVARPLNADTIGPVLGVGGSDYILEIARDPATPLEVLLDLAEVRGIDNASGIRHAARVHLRESGIDPDTDLGRATVGR